MDLKKVSNIEQLCSACEYEAKKGKGKGETVLSVSNGILDFTVTPDSGLDIYSLRHKGSNVAFLSKNGMTKNDMNGTFAEKFPGGFLYTCGLDAIGVTEGYPQHGSYHSLPSGDYAVRNNGEEVVIEGSVKNTALFGRNLNLNRTIKTAYNSGKIEITDTLKNEGYKDDKYILLYHFNLGYPFLDEGVTIDADIVKTAALSDYAKSEQNTAFVMTAPNKADEQVFCHTLKNKDGVITVTNKNLGKQITFTYDTEMLPCFTEWKSMLAGDYALGIEPATSSFVGERQYRTLKPGETAVFRICAEITEL